MVRPAAGKGHLGAATLPGRVCLDAAATLHGGFLVSVPHADI